MIALIYGGRIEEAANRAEGFVSLRPHDENGPIILARIAEACGNPAKAIEMWRAALMINPVQRQALIRLGALLVAAHRWQEAKACAKQLTAVYPAQPHGAILNAQIVQQSGGFARAAPLWSVAEQRFGKDIYFLRAYGSALLEAGAFEACAAVATRMRKISCYESLRLLGQMLATQHPYQDHTEFWRAACSELPDNTDLMRKFVHAALWARRQEDAQRAFGRLLLRDQPRASDADYIVGFCLAEIERGNWPAARASIRSFLKLMRGKPGYRAAALRLDRVILACLPRKSEAAVKISRSEKRFLHLVRNAKLNSDPAEPLEKIAALEATLARSGARCLFDTDISPGECRAFIRIVRERLAQNEPFSFVRLGDGEANAFQQTSSFSELLDADSTEREKVWWGSTLGPAARSDLAGRVRSAALDADALGVPTRELLLRNVRLEAGPLLSAGKSGRGLLVILEALDGLCAGGVLSGRILTSAHLPQDLQRWNLYSELFDGIDMAVLVSCHRNLPEMLQTRFSIRIAKHIVVPPGDAMREMQHRSLDKNELPPSSLTHALDELGGWPERRLVLVGAGYAGKAIVAEAAKRGGVALDLGSIFDRWLGAHTRTYKDLA